MSENPRPRSLLLERLESRRLLAAGFLSFSHQSQRPHGGHVEETRQAPRPTRNHDDQSFIDQSHQQQRRLQTGPQQTARLNAGHPKPGRSQTLNQPLVHRPPLQNPPPLATPVAPAAAINDPPTSISDSVVSLLNEPNPVVPVPSTVNAAPAPVKVIPVSVEVKTDPVEISITLAVIARETSPNTAAQREPKTDTAVETDDATAVERHPREIRDNLDLDVVAAESADASQLRPAWAPGVNGSNRPNDAVLDIREPSDPLTAREMEPSISLIPRPDDRSDALTSIDGDFENGHDDQPDDNEPWELNRNTIQHLRDLAVDPQQDSQFRIDEAMAGWFDGPGGMIVLEGEGEILAVSDPASVDFKIPLNAILGSHRWLEIASAGQAPETQVEIRDAVLAAIAGEQADHAAPLESPTQTRDDSYLYSGLALVASTLVITRRRKSKHLMSTDRKRTFAPR